jgi:hypothetical protein
MIHPGNLSERLYVLWEMDTLPPGELMKVARQIRSITREHTLPVDITGLKVK